MNKQELAEKISVYQGITQREAMEQIDTIFNIIYKELESLGQVKLRGFGTFDTAQRNAKTIINPQTKDKILVPDRYVVVFTPSKNLREVVRNSGTDD